MPSIVPLTLPVKVPALSKFFALSGLLPEFSLVFSVLDNLLSTFVCEPLVLSNNKVSLSGNFPALSLFSFVLSALENTFTSVEDPSSILNENIPSVALSENSVLFGFTLNVFHFLQYHLHQSHL